MENWWWNYHHFAQGPLMKWIITWNPTPHFPDLIPTTCPIGDLWYIWWVVAPGALWDTNFPCIICSCSHPLPVICWLNVLPAVHILNLGFDVNIALVNAPKLKMQQLLPVGLALSQRVQQQPQQHWDRTVSIIWYSVLMISDCGYHGISVL